MKRTSRRLMPAAFMALLAAVAITVSACSSVQPSIGQYAIVTGQGPFSNQDVKHFVNPGDHIKVGSGDTIWYVPANVRNYVTAPSNGDRGTPQAEITGSSRTEPGMPVYTWSYLAFELNPGMAVNPTAHHSMAASFFAFCLKYGCASQTAQDSSSNATLSRSSDPGWLNMLDEVFPRAIDNATRDVITSYGPDLWTNRGEWGDFGDKIAAALPAEIAKMTGSGGYQYFCGTGSTESRCAPFTFLVNNVTPVDPGVQAAYNQQITSAYQAQSGAARFKAATEIYGPDASWFLGMKDLIAECAADHVTCNIYAGNAPVHP